MLLNSSPRVLAALISLALLGALPAALPDHGLSALKARQPITAPEGLFQSLLRLFERMAPKELDPRRGFEMLPYVPIDDTRSDSGTNTSAQRGRGSA